jgi:hypothetical protein
MQGKEKLFHHSLNDDKAYRTVDWRDPWSSEGDGSKEQVDGYK